jgi:heme ABC exporter ATP-binding subunit CcmA
VIELHGVRVIYGRTIALQGIDLVLRPGVTGVFGPNGSGKSTLLRTLAGLLMPSAGEIDLDGRPLRSADEDVRGRIGYAGHEPGLYPRLTVRENLELFAGLYGLDLRVPDEMLDRMGLNDYADTRAGALSAGLKRRVGVSRALLHEPDVLLLDEPYANLDDYASDLISEAVKRWRTPHRLAMIATHGAKRVKAFADAALILQRGRVISYRIRTGPFSSEPAETESAESPT